VGLPLFPVIPIAFHTSLLTRAEDWSNRYSVSHAAAQSARGLAQPKTLREVYGSWFRAPASWANASRLTCDWAQAYYAYKRAEGHGHASALRCLGKRWLKILWRLWQNRQPYDEAKYLAQLQRRGALTWNQLSATKACE
jgi:hypothetical protein